MGNIETPKTPVKAAPNTVQAQVAPTVKGGIRDAARQVARGAALDRSPYLKMAFTNPYNLSLFTGALAAAGLTLNPVLAVVALGLEGLWLLHAPDNKRLRHVLWDPKFDMLRKAIEAQDRATRLATVGDEERQRVNALVVRQEEIRRLAAQNPSFTGDLLRNELVKTERLVDAFVEMAVTCARYEAYLDSIDANALEKDRKRYEALSKSAGPDDQQAQIARKNLAIVTKRVEKMAEIKRYLSVARGQLDLIENSFQLIADQIVTMQSPQELSGQLDELLDGVEAIRQTAQDTDKILNGMGIEREM
jgi:hypothetical protein